jgi:hypothetical protein
MRSERMGMVPPWRMRFAAICEVFGVVEAGITSTMDLTRLLMNIDHDKIRLHSSIIRLRFMGIRDHIFLLVRWFPKTPDSS